MPLKLLQPHFFCDKTLLKLARYLRFAGFDTLVRQDYSYEKIAQICKKEKRIFLTRNKCLKKRLFPLDLIIIIEHEIYLQQIQFVISIFPVHNKLIASRCILCNRVLVQDTANNTITFCRKCKKKYWQGSHYNMMLKAINGKI